MDRLSVEEQDWLLRFARRSLKSFLTSGERLAAELPFPALRAPGAAFVTLRVAGTRALRGCRGETRPTRPLAESVRDQTIAAALDDPRFEPVTASEVSRLSIHISVLSALAPITPAAIVLGKHGLMIRHRLGSGLLLPQVAPEAGFQTPHEFLEALCRKAHLPEESWLDSDTRLFGFVTQNFGEHQTTCETQP